MTRTRDVLLFISFSLNPNNRIFSHQAEIAERLSSSFSEVILLTDEGPGQTIYSNGRVYCFGVNRFQSRKLNRAISTLIFLSLAISVGLKFRSRLIVFGHMTDIYSFFLSPVTFLLKIPHFLWYAHVSNSIYLRLSHRLLTGVVTSTEDSCPVRSPKVRVIGQGINFEHFPLHIDRDYGKSRNLVYFGRLDRSKQIDYLIRLLLFVRTINSNATLTLIGNPTPDNRNYLHKLFSQHADLIQNGSLIVLPAKSRHDLGIALREYDLFVHAFLGSLDKTLLEAASTGIPILTLNPPFNRISAEYGMPFQSPDSTLSDMYIKFTNESVLQRKSNCQTLAMKVQQDHSIEVWIKKLLAIIL